MDHLPATPRDQWRRVQLARYLIDYAGVRVEQMRFDEQGRVTDFGLPQRRARRDHRRGHRVPHLRLPGQVPRRRVGLRPSVRRFPAERHRELPVPAERTGPATDPPTARIPVVRAERMSGSFRVIDAGVREGRYNIALDQAMIELHQAGRDPRHDPLHPLSCRSRSSAATRRCRSEVDLDYCRDHGIGDRPADHRRRRDLSGRGPVGLGARVRPPVPLGGASLGDVARVDLRGRGRGLAPPRRRRPLSAAQRHRGRRPQDQRHRRLLRRRHADLSGHGAGRHGSGGDGRRAARSAGQDREARPRFGRAARRDAARAARTRDARDRARSSRRCCRGFRERLGLEFERGAADRRRGDAARSSCTTSQIGRDEFVAEIDGPPGGGAGARRRAHERRRHDHLLPAPRGRGRAGASDRC